MRSRQDQVSFAAGLATVALAVGLASVCVNRRHRTWARTWDLEVAV